MQTVFYSTLFLSNREQIFLKSVLVMYNARGKALWSQNDSQYDVVILGKDVTDEQVASIPKTVKVLLSMSPRLQKQGCDFFYVNTPIKATELIEKFILVEKSLMRPASGRSKASDNEKVLTVSRKVRLLQWPKTEVLARDKAYLLLSALLSKCAMSLDELAAISAKSENTCRSFIEHVIKSGDAEFVTITMVPSINSVRKNNSAKRGLLDRIRASLGLFQK